MIRYVLDTLNFGLKLELTSNTNKQWKIVCFNDSNYAGDLVSRRSVNGFIHYVLGVPASWESKTQKSVRLSTSEAKWVALSEAVKEIMFMIQLLGNMKIYVKLTVMVRVSSVGVKFMTSNITTA